MGSGLFVNDLFNGEALSGGMEHERGIFRKDLFSGQPLGQTTPLTTTAAVTPASDSLISQLATGDKTGGGTAMSTGDKSGAIDPSSAYTPYATPTTTDYGSGTSSDVPWVPIALIGGAVVLTVGFVMMSSKKKTSTANRRHARRARRNRRRHR